MGEQISFAERPRDFKYRSVFSNCFWRYLSPIIRPLCAHRDIAGNVRFHSRFPAAFCLIHRQKAGIFLLRHTHRTKAAQSSLKRRFLLYPKSAVCFMYGVPVHFNRAGAACLAGAYNVCTAVSLFIHVSTLFFPQRRAFGNLITK